MQAEREKVLRLMKTARGQMDGIIRMMEEDRYCIDLSTQLLATEAILKKVNTEILAAHLKSCVADAKTDEERNEKIEEMTALLAKLMK